MTLTLPDRELALLRKLAEAGRAGVLELDLAEHREEIRSLIGWGFATRLHTRVVLTPKGRKAAAA
jgi:hypothetical protein